MTPPLWVDPGVGGGWGLPTDSSMGPKPGEPSLALAVAATNKPGEPASDKRFSLCSKVKLVFHVTVSLCSKWFKMNKQLIFTDGENSWRRRRSWRENSRSPAVGSDGRGRPRQVVRRGVAVRRAQGLVGWGGKHGGHLSNLLKKMTHSLQSFIVCTLPAKESQVQNWMSSFMR